MKEQTNEVSIVVTTSEPQTYLAPVNFESRRGTVTDQDELTDLMMQTSRRPSGIIVTALRRPSMFIAQRKFIMDLFASPNGSNRSLNAPTSVLKENHMANVQKQRNRRMGNDSLSLSLSALYAKIIFVLGIAFPVTDILSTRAESSKNFYQGFYLFLYLTSVAFVIFVYSTHLKNRQLFTIIDSYEAKSGDKNGLSSKKRLIRYGSFYLRVGAIAFGIGSMVYSGLEFGQYFELEENDKCQNMLIALNPAARMLLTIVQMQFIFLNTKELHMKRHKVISRFGLMHMVATNLCEWVYVLIEETKHEIDHLGDHSIGGHGYGHGHGKDMDNTTTNVTHSIYKRATSVEIVVDCRRTNIMGRLVQNASPFLFPCTIEYSLICAVILYEMWKKIKLETITKREHQESMMGHHAHKDVHQLSVDCSRAHRGMFAGILVIVVTIISLIMFFVLNEEKTFKSTAVNEVTYIEILLYILTGSAVVAAMYRMQDLKYSKQYQHGIGLDCTLLLLAQSGVYIYSMFSMLGCYFTIEENDYSRTGLYAEIVSLVQTSIQTIFILNAWWRRTKGKQQNKTKPGREIITFLLVANMAIWFINTLIKNRASFRQSHLDFFGLWAWTIITHTSMPLAIFYRFHSTICLFEIWKTSYKMKPDINLAH